MLLVQMKLNRLISTISINHFDGTMKQVLLRFLLKRSSLYISVDSQTIGHTIVEVTIKLN